MAQYSSTLATSLIKSLYSSKSLPNIPSHLIRKPSILQEGSSSMITLNHSHLGDGILKQFNLQRCFRQTSEYYTKETGTSKARWYILFIISSYAAVQYCIWNTFGPISSSIKKSFNWDNGDVATLANWDTLIFILLSLQVCWLIEKRGMRQSLLAMLLLVVIGGAVKCTSMDGSIAKWTLNVGQIMNGLGGMLAQTAGPIVSNTWFPPEERITATAVASLSSSLGLATSYIIGPLIVSDLSNVTLNGKLSTTETNRKIMKEQIRFLLILELGVAMLIFIAATVYFPNKPKIPPSLSASLPKSNFISSFRILFFNKNFMIILTVAASVTGVYSGWSAVLALNFQDHGLPLSQTECGWIGFAATLASVCSGVAVGVLSDKYPGNIKLFLILLYVMASLAFSWVTLMCNGVIGFDKASIYIACIVGGFSVNGSIPLLYELTIELTYPVPETASIGILSVVNNVFTFGFLLSLNMPGIGVSWMNWVLLGTCIVSVALLLIFRETYERTVVDQTTSQAVHGKTQPFTISGI